MELYDELEETIDEIVDELSEELKGNEDFIQRLKKLLINTMDNNTADDDVRELISSLNMEISDGT
ncbi:MAG: hypothetical protein ABEH43_06780 [Flavobacteriales bacterium]